MSIIHQGTNQATIKEGNRKIGNIMGNMLFYYVNHKNQDIKVTDRIEIKIVHTKIYHFVFTYYSFSR